MVSWTTALRVGPDGAERKGASVAVAVTDGNWSFCPNSTGPATVFR